MIWGRPVTEELARKALEHWDIGPALVALVAARENTVYRVETTDRKFALRFHRPGYRRQCELKSELDWMAVLSQGGLNLPKPVAAKNGSFCVIVAGHAVDMLSWLEGRPMSEYGAPTSAETVTQSFAALGKSMAQLHRLSDEWSLPESFSRPAWDVDGLVGDAPLWGRFWENPTLTADQAKLFTSARDRAASILRRRCDELDYGLIHADLIPENVLLENGKAQLIDFDDSGFGFRLFDIATTLNRAHRDGHRQDQCSAFLAGYQSQRRIDLEFLGLFQGLRALTYLGWIVPRMGEAGAQARNERFIREAEFWTTELLRAA